MKLGLFHFQVLYDVLHDMHFIHEEEELGNYIVSKLAVAFNAEGGTIFKLMRENKLYPLASYGVPVEKLRQSSFEVGKGVVGWVVQYLQPVKVLDPSKDMRFYGKIDTSTGFKTKSIIATPILAKGQVLGVLEFLNRKEGNFVMQDLELISMLGREIGIVMQNIKLIHDLEKRQELQESVTESLSSGLIVVGQDGLILNLNRYGRKILDIHHIDHNEVVHYKKALTTCPKLGAIIEKVISSSDPLYRQEANVTINSEEKIIGYSGVPVVDKHNERHCSAIIFQDITNIKK